MTTVPQTIRTYNVWTEDQPFAARTERVDGPHDPADPELRAEMARQGILGLTHIEVRNRKLYGGMDPETFFFASRVERGLGGPTQSQALSFPVVRAYRQLAEGGAS